LSSPSFYSVHLAIALFAELREGEDKLSPYMSHNRSLPTMNRTHQLPDEAATRALAASIGTQVHAGDLVFLSGPLGAGKTTFAQELARSLGVSEPVSSPTFVLICEYTGRVPLLHCDAYRLEGLDFEELTDVGLEDFASRSDAVRLVEWPEMVRAFLPPPTWTVRIEFAGEGKTRLARVKKMV